MSTEGSVPYAGDITPERRGSCSADDPEAVLVDVRTDAEWRFVGVPDLSSLGRDVVYVEWNRTDGKHNDGFVDELLEHVAGPATSVRWCSCAAPATARSARPRRPPRPGIAPSYNVLDGFEGNLDDDGHRGGRAGRPSALPWKQS